MELASARYFGAEDVAFGEGMTKATLLKLRLTQHSTIRTPESGWIEWKGEARYMFIFGFGGE